jgi:predicted kinase
VVAQARRATFELQLRVAAELLRAGVGLVLEGNFDAQYDPLSRLPPHRPVQIHCTVPPETLRERFAARDRHPGHADAEVLDELRRGAPDRRSYRLAVDATIDVDTSDAVDVGALARHVRTLA